MQHTCQVTTPDGIVRRVEVLRAANKLDAVRQALATFPRGSRASCRAQADVVRDLLADRMSWMPRAAS